MNSVPHHQKLCRQVSHIWGNHRGQHMHGAMSKPLPGRTTFLIMVPPLPGKYILENMIIQAFCEPSVLVVVVHAFYFYLIEDDEKPLLSKMGQIPTLTFRI